MQTRELLSDKNSLEKYKFTFSVFEDEHRRAQRGWWLEGKFLPLPEFSENFYNTDLFKFPRFWNKDWAYATCYSN